MATYEQFPRLRFKASSDEDAHRQQDEAATAMNRAGAGLQCHASLALPPTAPRRLDPLPRQALIVSIPQALAAVAALATPEDTRPVHLELSGTRLTVRVAGTRSTYDLNGHPVAYRPGEDPVRHELLIEPGSLRAQVERAVADGDAEASLWHGTSTDEDDQGRGVATTANP